MAIENIGLVAVTEHAAKKVDGANKLGTAQTDASGNWKFTPTSALADGAHAITAKAGSTVAIYDNGVELGSVTADASGNWTFTPAAPISEGPHDFSVTATDAAGNTSVPSDVFSIVTDYTAPANTGLVITDDVGAITGALSDGDTTDDNQPTFSGEAEPGSTVIVYDNGTPIGSVTADASGTWSFTPADPLVDGPHDFTTEVVDGAGNSSGQSDPTHIIIDTVAPAQPSIDSIYDDVGSIQGELVNGGVTDDSQPTLSGKAEAGSTVSVFDNGEKLGETTADASGNWTFTPAAPISEGPHDFSVTATDAAGNTSVPSDVFSIVTDYPAPANTGLVITDDVGAITGALSDGDSTDDNQPTFSGEAEPGSPVIVYDNGTAIGSDTADESGNWSFTPADPISDGPHDFTTEVVDGAGNSSGQSDPTHIIIDTTGVSVAITHVIDDVGSITGDITNGGVTDDARPEFQGTGKADSIVTIQDGGTVLGSVVVGSDGTWSFTPSSDLAEGEHSISVTAVDKTGTVSDPVSFSFTVDTTAPAQPSIDSIYDDVGAIQGELVNGGMTDDSQPTLSGKAEAGSLVTVYDNGVELGSVTADASGNWSFTPAAPISEGPHAFTVDATDAAGNTSVPSDAFNIVTDYTTPSVPVIVSVFDAVGAVTGNLSQGSITDDAHPLISGTADAGSVVELYDGATKLGSTLADASGNWTFQPSAALADGGHDITTKAINAMGSISDPSNPFDFIVDTAPATPPVITHLIDDAGTITGDIAQGGVTDDKRPDIKGTADANAKVSVYIDGTLVGTTTADASGNWMVTPTSDLADGAHSVTAKSTNSMGDSPASNTWSFIVDTVCAAPVITSVLDSVGIKTGYLANGDTTDDSKPKISGTAEANSTVAIYDGATKIGSAVADASGNWTFTPTTALSYTTHSITAKATDVAGNLSPSSNTFGFKVVSPYSNGSESFDTLADGQTSFPSALPSGVTITKTGNTQASSNAQSEDPVQAAHGVVMYMHSGASMTLTLPGLAQKVTFQSTAEIANTVQFLDASGNVIGTLKTKTATGGGTVWNTETFTAPAGQFIAKIYFLPNSDPNDGYCVDNLTWSSSVTATRTPVEVVESTQVTDHADTAVAAHADTQVSGDTSVHVTVNEGQAQTVAQAETTQEQATQQVTDGATQTLTATTAEASATHTSEALAVAVDDSHTPSTQVDSLADSFFGSTADQGEVVILNTNADSYFASTSNQGIHGGDGVDVLKLVGGGNELDLTLATSQGKLTGVEIIDITGSDGVAGHVSGANTLTLSLKDVLDNGQADLFHNTDTHAVQMMVKGDDNDTVNLRDLEHSDSNAGSWTEHGSVTVGNTAYTVYEHTGHDAELLIQQGVHVNLI